LDFELSPGREIRHPAALQQLTGLLVDGTWVPMATVHFAAMTAALLAGWRCGLSASAL
jgi:hypothetical protein